MPRVVAAPLGAINVTILWQHARCLDDGLSQAMAAAELVAAATAWLLIN